MININDGFNIGAAAALDSRMVLTKAEMLAMKDAVMPDVYMASCKDDGQLYLYNKENTVDEITGKFQILKAEGGALVFTQSEWDALENKPDIGTQVIISDDDTKQPENVINDKITSTNKTWSSQKIATEMIKIWTGTQEEYNAITIKDENTLYLIQ